MKYEYTKLEIKGSYSTANGKIIDGAFEFIKDKNGIITHRFFKPTK